MLLLNSCGTSYKVKDGQDAYNLKQYAVAVTMLKKELEQAKRNEERNQKMFLIGRCFNELLQYDQALEWYSMAERANYGAGATLQKAYVLKNLMRYDEAILNFESLKPINTLSQEVNKQILVCKSLKLQREGADKNINIEELFDDDLYSDYGAVIYDNDFLVFTSDREMSTGNSTYDWTGKKFSDLFIVDKESKSVQRFDALINTKYNEGTPSFNSDYSICVFSRCYDNSEYNNQYCKLMYSMRVDGIWVEPIEMPFTKKDINYGQPCFFEKDSVLIFSAMGENAAQGFDLWYCEFNGSTWSEPFLLPSTINSTFNEHFPTSDGDTLYYSSDNNIGFGGLDIYKTWVQNDGSWAKPIHLPFPYNSGGDDFSFVVDRFAPLTRNLSSQGYFTSSRSNEGHDKLYQYKVFINADNDVVKTNTKPKAETVKEIYLALKVLQSNNDKSIKKRIALSRAKVILEQQDFNTDKNGLMLHQLEIDKNYIIKIEKDSFLSKSIVVSTKDLIFDEDQKVITLNKEVELDKIEKGKEIILENIYYEFDEWVLTKEALPSLDKLVEILNENPTINIELGSHTDCRGDDAYNQELSRKRAESVVNYLKSKGINGSRLEAKGYGETLPANPCLCESCDENMHQQNRRTSFKVL